MFDAGSLLAADTADMTVMSGGKPTDWVWTFAGPGHEKAIEQSNRLARERLKLDAEQERSRVNGKKWRADPESPEEARRRHVDFIVERLVGWSDVSMAGKPFPFSVENARAFLGNPAAIAVATQALEFLGDDRSFTRRSAES